MKQFAVAAVALLSVGAAQAENEIPYVIPYPTTATDTWETCRSRELDGATLSMPCGRSKNKGEACPVFVRQKSVNDTAPIIDCDQFVQIGLVNANHNSARNLWGIVAGSAPEAKFGDATTKFGLAPGGFQHLCPFACTPVVGDVLKRCVDNPADCQKDETARDPPELVLVGGTVGGLMIGGFAQLGKQELAYKFEQANVIEPHKPEEWAKTPIAEHQLYNGGLFPLQADMDLDKNCPEVKGNFTKSDFEGECGVDGKVPCIVGSTQENDCSVGKCKTITFYRPGIRDRSGTYCSGGICESMGTIERQVKVVAHGSLYNETIYQSAGPRGIFTPQAWNEICPFICGEITEDKQDFVPVCVTDVTKCTGGRVVIGGKLEFDGKNFTIPGSFLTTPVLAVKEVESICRSSAFGTSAPGLLVLAIAAAATTFSSS